MPFNPAGLSMSCSYIFLSNVFFFHSKFYSFLFYFLLFSKFLSVTQHSVAVYHCTYVYPFALLFSNEKLWMSDWVKKRERENGRASEKYVYLLYWFSCIFFFAESTHSKTVAYRCVWDELRARAKGWTSKRWREICFLYRFFVHILLSFHLMWYMDFFFSFSSVASMLHKNI